jgi:hypothetical protein
METRRTAGVHFSFGGKKWKNRANYGMESLEAMKSGEDKSRVPRNYSNL